MNLWHLIGNLCLYIEESGNQFETILDGQGRGPQQIQIFIKDLDLDGIPEGEQ